MSSLHIFYTSFVEIRINIIIFQDRMRHTWLRNSPSVFLGNFRAQLNFDLVIPFSGPDMSAPGTSISISECADEMRKCHLP